MRANSLQNIPKDTTIAIYSVEMIKLPQHIVAVNIVCHGIIFRLGRITRRGGEIAKQFLAATSFGEKEYTSTFFFSSLAAVAQW